MRSPVGFSAVGYLDDIHDKDVVFNSVEDSITTLSQSVLLFGTQLLAAGRARVLGERPDPRHDEPQVPLGKASKLPGRRFLDLDPIFCHAP